MLAPMTADTFTISCDECAMQCTSACADCVVTYLLSDDRVHVLDRDQTRVVRLLSAAGLVPELKFREAG